MSFSSMLLETSFDVHTEGRRARPKRLLALLHRLDVSLQSVAQECTAASLSLSEKELNNIIHSDTVFIWLIGRFLAEEQVSATTQVKSSVARGIKAKLVEQMPNVEVRTQ